MAETAAPNLKPNDDDYIEVEPDECEQPTDRETGNQDSSQLVHQCNPNQFHQGMDA